MNVRSPGIPTRTPWNAWQPLIAGEVRFALGAADMIGCADEIGSWRRCDIVPKGMSVRCWLSVSHRGVLSVIVLAGCVSVPDFVSADADAAATDAMGDDGGASLMLAVVRAGAGTGSVASSPPGIACGADCAELYPRGTLVTLTATPDAGSAFSGWSGGGCAGTTTCDVTVEAATTITATFGVASAQLTVMLAGDGSGTVTSSPAGIQCGGDCYEAYPTGTTVTLTAAVSSGSTFTGWSGGGCTGSGTCTTTSPGTITATFAPPPEQRIGYPNLFGTYGTLTPNQLTGQRLIVSQSFTLRKLGITVRNSGPQVQLALYKELNGNPGPLVAHTSPTTISVGAVELSPVESGITLTPGAYWISVIGDGGAEIYCSTEFGEWIRYVNLQFGSAIPTSFAAAAGTYAYASNMYLVVH